MREKKEARDATLPDTEERAITTYREETAEGVDWDATTPTANTAEGQIRAITTCYYHLVAPTVVPIEVERPLRGQISPTLALSGKPDIVTAGAIRDLKTGKSGETYHAQGGGYIMLAKAAGGKPPVSFIVDHLPRKTLSKPYPGPQEYRYSAALAELEARESLREVMRSLAAWEQTPNPAVLPHNVNSNLCSPKYCRAYGTDICPVSKTFRE
jgi:hypothetical protein